MEFNYRNAIVDDLEKVVAIYNSTIPSRLATADTAPVTMESKLAWFQQHTTNKRPLWIIENGENECIGWVSFQDFYGRPAYAATAEISIYLQESQRGRGVGERVLMDVLEKAPQLGIKTLLGFIFSHNIPSLKLFRKLGFEDWGMLPNVALLDGLERSVVILGKRLG